MSSVKLQLQKAKFLKSAANLKQCPNNEAIEIAIVGRSNSGKSSCINAICRANLAKTSKTPGRTLLKNIFELSETRRLVDLPGYGYAKVDQKTSRMIGYMLSSYIANRFFLKGLILLMDCRRPLTELDTDLISLALDSQRELHIVLTKSDKISKSQAAKVLKEVKEQLPKSVSVQLFSATKRVGIDELQSKLTSWYNN